MAWRSKSVIVACTLWQPPSGECDFGLDYVLRLKRGFERSLPIPHRFVCFSNVDVPCERVPLSYDWPGWWAKMDMFNPSFAGDLLAVDLDTVLVGDVSAFVQRTRPTFIRGFHGRRKPFGSGFMFLPHETRARVWADWCRRPLAHMKAHRGDQDYLTPLFADDEFDTWQEELPGQLLSYKLDCKAKFNDTLPEQARVIVFHGKPRPAQMPDDHWIKAFW